MQRLVHILFAIFMLVHALVPALPIFVCTDGGRSLNPCSPQEERATPSPSAAWNEEDCCKLTAPAVVDASPPVSIDPHHVLTTQLALLPVATLSPLSSPPQQRIHHLGRGDPVLRGPPLSLYTVLRI